MSRPTPIWAPMRKDGSIAIVVHQSRKVVGRDKSGRVTVAERD
jgi:hypothetical protein